VLWPGIVALLAVFALACGEDEADQAEAPSPAAGIATLALPTPAPTAAVMITPVLSGNALLQALRGGGYTFVFRHAITEQAQVDDLTAAFRDIREGGDRVPGDDCSIQRNLSPAGRDQARQIGQQIERLAIPYARALASPFCRTKETAGFAFGLYDTNSVLSLLTSADNSEAVAADTRRLLAAVPPADRNAVLVTHVTNITLVGLPSIAEGDALVLKPDGMGWTLVAHVRPDDWKGME
jgi:phosphohistidine phosphatase SixA